MDKSTIVVCVNIAYGLLYLIILFIRLRQYNDKVWVRSNTETVTLEYFGYTLSGGLMYIAMVAFPFIRNHHIFNHIVPITFIVQFVFQFVILVLYLIDIKVTRYMVSYGIAGFLIFMTLNGLFKMEVDYNKLELTTIEVQNISKDLDDFSKTVTDRVQRVNNDMVSVLQEIKERQKQIEIVNNLLKEKEDEHKSIREKLQVDKEKAEALLKVLGVRPPTLADRLVDAGIGAVVGLFLTIIWNRFFGKRVLLNS
jgi:hypothetical protein